MDGTRRGDGRATPVPAVTMQGYGPMRALPGPLRRRHAGPRQGGSDVGDYEQLGFPELIDIATLAGMLGVGERYVRRMVAEGRVPTVTVGRLARFDLAEIRCGIEEQRRPSRS